MRPLTWQRSLETSTLTMYRVSKIRMQIHWRPSLLHWPFQLEPQRGYSSTFVTCTVTHSSMKTVKIQEETFKLNNFLRLRQVSNLGIDDSLTLTSSCTAYCQMTLRRQLPSERKLLNFITMRSCEYCIADCTKEFYSNVFHTKRHKGHSKKFMMVRVKLTSLAPSSKTGLEDLATTGRR